MTALLDDLRFAARSFRRNPAFSLVVVSTLGVGIAAAALVFSVVNAVLYRLYDVYPDPGRLVLLLEDNRRLGASTIASSRSVAEWKASARSFEQLGGMAGRRATVGGHGEEPQSVVSVGVSEDVLPMLGAAVVAGRPFTATDHAPGAVPVVLLAHSLWQQQYGSRPDVVGRSITIDGRPHAVVGVLSRRFSVLPFFGVDPGLVVPIALDPAGDRSQRAVFALARLRRGATVEQAAAEMRAIAASVAASDPAARGWEITVRKARGLDPKGDAGFIVVLGVGVGFVLLIVCANVTNLLLSRGAARAREVATRLAVGAGRWRIARQMLTETALLAAAGCAAGLFLAYWGCRGISWAVAGSVMSFLDLTLDTRAAAFAAIVSVISALAAGLVPSIRSSRTPVIEVLKEGGAMGRLSAGRLRTLLVGVEIALALVLLVGSGLILRGLVNLRHNEPGFDPRQLAFMSVTLSGDRYAAPAGRTQYVDEALTRLGGRPGIEAAATSFVPMTGAELPPQPFGLQGRPAGGDSAPSAGVISVSPAFFSAMRIPLKAGRAFAPADREGSLPVAIVNSRLVEKWFQGRRALGAAIDVAGTPRTIVGIVGDVRNFHLNVNAAPTVYLPYGQSASESIAFVVRSAGDLGAAVSSAKVELKAIDASQVVRGGRSFEKVIAQTLGGFDMSWMIAAALAAVALGLASVGLYSVIAYSVVRRTREIGIRMALGASPGQVVRETIGQGIRLAAWAAIPGTLLALAVGKMLSFKLHRVSPLDPAVLGGVLALVFTMVLLATYVPARRAARIDPVRATRCE